MAWRKRLRARAQRVSRSPAWSWGRFILVGLGFLLQWGGWTGPELLDRLGGDFLTSDAFRTALVVLGLVLVVAVVLVPAPFRPEEWTTTWEGDLVPRRSPSPGYVGRCEWSEGKWWLTLERPSEEEARFFVTVKHESGAAAHTEFWQSGRTIVSWYPDHFEVSGMSARKPWGEYAVTWHVHHPGMHDIVEAKFSWQP